MQAKCKRSKQKTITIGEKAFEGREEKQSDQTKKQSMKANAKVVQAMKKAALALNSDCSK